MKTKFFKKLSFVLVVAMVLSLLVPATGAFAASAKLNSSKKYLHLGREESGENEFNFNIKNKQKGWKYAWESFDEDVVEVNAKNGVTTATGVGKTKVTVLITDDDGEEVDTLSATVTVRDNIDEVTISNKVEKLSVGQEYDYNRSYVTESGSTKKTSSITRWTVEPADKATIDEKGVFVATEAGEYTVTALSFQSKARYNAWLDDAEANAGEVLDTDETKVVVAGSMLEAKQVDKDTVDVTFDTAMADAKDKISVYQLVGTTKVKQFIKEVKMDDDKKVATVDMYVDFVQEATYHVSYPDMEDETFIAARKKAEDVAAIKVDTTRATINKLTDIDVKLLNTDGVDITTPELSSRVSLEADDVAGTFVDANDKTVIIFDKDISVKITATYHTLVYDNEGNEVGNLVAAGIILGVEEDATNLTGLKAWTIVDADPDFSDVKQTLSADDTGLRLFVQFNTKTGSDTATVDSNEDALDFVFESSDDNTLIIASDGTLIPLKAGSVVVVVKYGTGDATKVPVGAVSIVISSAAKAQNLVLTPSSFSLSDATALDDKRKVSLKVTDQLNREMEIEEIEVKKLSGPSGSAELASDLTADKVDKTVEFSGKDATPGIYNYQITVTDKNDNEIKRTVQVTVQNSKNAEATRYVLEIGDNKVDVKAADKKLSKGVSIKLFGLAGGIKVTQEDFDSTESEGNFKLVIEAPKTAWDGNHTHLVDDEFVLLSATSGNAIEKAPVGNYKVTAFEYKDTDKTPGGDKWVAIDYKYFVVEDTQVKPALAKVNTLFFETVVTTVADNNADVMDAAEECFVIKLDGTELPIVGVEASGTTSSIGIKTLTVRQTFVINDAGDTAYIDHKVDINRTIKFQD